MSTAYEKTEAGRIIADLQRQIAALQRKPATTRMDSARRAKQDAITRELCWAAIGARIWPARLAPPATRAKAQQSFAWLLHLDTPAGHLVYRLTEEEAALFEHVPRVDADITPSGDKLAILHALAMDGF